MQPVDRRAVLRLSLLAIAAAGCHGKSQPMGPVAAGHVTDYAVDYFAFVPGQPLLLGRDAGGLYAMSSFCTYDDCDMSDEGSLDASRVTCDCCSSQWDHLGYVRRSPAIRPLPHYRVDVAADGGVTIQPGVTVDITARTAVPKALGGTRRRHPGAEDDARQSAS